MGSIYIWAVYFYFFVLTVLPVQESRPSMKITKYKLIEDVSNRNLTFVYIFRHATSPSLYLMWSDYGEGGGIGKRKRDDNDNTDPPDPQYTLYRRFDGSGTGFGKNLAYLGHFK